MPKLQQGTQVSKELHDCTGLAQGNVKFSSMSAKCRAIVSVYSKAAGPVHGGCLVDSDIPGHWGARLWAARQAAHQHNALFRAVHYVSPEDPTQLPASAMYMTSALDTVWCCAYGIQAHWS